MIAVIAGFLLVSYLLGPGAIYRLAFSLFLPSRRLQRTRSEEIVFSVIITLLPMFFTWVILLHTPAGSQPHISSQLGKVDSYRLMLSSLVNDTAAKSPILVSAYFRSFVEQIRFVTLLWILCFAEGLLAGWFISKYGNYDADSPQKYFCDNFLLRHVSEWQILFTTMSLSIREQKAGFIQVDVLCSGVLYRGRLVNWFTDTDGKLAGIFIDDAERYRRDALERDRSAGEVKDVNSYWRVIPGARMYFPAGTISNYNIRYADLTQSYIVSDELGEKVTVKLISSANSPRADISAG